MLIPNNNEDKQERIFKEVEPLAIDARSMMDVVNEDNKDQDDEYLGDNIKNIATEGDLYPKKIQSLMQSMDKITEKNNVVQSAMQTRS